MVFSSPPFILLPLLTFQFLLWISFKQQLQTIFCNKILQVCSASFLLFMQCTSLITFFSLVFVYPAPNWNFSYKSFSFFQCIEIYFSSILKRIYRIEILSKNKRFLSECFRLLSPLHIILDCWLQRLAKPIAATAIFLSSAPPLLFLLTIPFTRRSWLSWSRSPAALPLYYQWRLIAFKNNSLIKQEVN